MKFDYLIVGAGLFGSTFAYLAKKKGLSVIVIDQREHVGGNLYCEEKSGIITHMYGPHIFHTDNKQVFDFVTSLVDVHNYFHQPIANCHGELFNLPFNMNTFRQMWNVKTPHEAEEIIKRQSSSICSPKNMEEMAISMVGMDLYQKLIKEYTEKQWGAHCSQLPVDIIKRLPLRFSYDNNYFNDNYQFIPKGGYNRLFDKLLEDVPVLTSCPYEHMEKIWRNFAKKMLFTGRIDSLFDYKYGVLPYRSVRFEHEEKGVANYQGCAVMNYTTSDIPYTRSVEHRFFEESNETSKEHTIVTFEYPNGLAHKGRDDAFYPISTPQNEDILSKYKEAVASQKDIIVGGRLADYRYYDMDDTIAAAMKLFDYEMKMLNDGK